MPPPETTLPSLRSLLHPATRPGSVHLTVSDLERSVAFYSRVVGLEVVERSGAAAALGAGDVGGGALLGLAELPGARRVSGRTGLYHFALLVPTRPDLARALRNLIATETRIGSADHLVSEALYLWDPDGNGIEIYRDRPRSEWTYEGGEIRMDTLPLDLADLLAEPEPEPRPGAGAGLPPGTVLGHMHLQVAHLGPAERFYREGVGFARMTRFGTMASFLSAGGYHHHLGINTWAGEGAPPPPPDAAGLRHFVVWLANPDELGRLRERLAAGGWPFAEEAGGLFVRDPSGNGMRFEVDPAAGTA